MPPFAPPYGKLTKARFFLIQTASAATSPMSTRREPSSAFDRPKGKKMLDLVPLKQRLIHRPYGLDKLSARFGINF